ncbi:MAG: cation:proton antiporter [Chthoniobacterales bacterium]|nr:cation:proton antiporter [Chthoniobacterales bacterium]
MPHDISLISTVAVAFVAAFLLGMGAQRLGFPPLIGYLLAGVAIGPFSPGFVGDRGLAGQLAEIGVMLLMFGVGLHFSLSDLLAVRRVAIPGAVGQIVIATLIGAGIMMAAGWSLGGALVLGVSLSVASTVVMLKALEERGALASANGRIAVGWLIVEDLVMVLALVLIPALAPGFGGTDNGHAPALGGSLVWTLAVSIGKVALFVGLALLIGPRIMPWILRQTARTGSRELFTLAVLAAALGIAFGAAELFGVSFALGAFFAGMVMHESELSHKAATNSLPLQDAFAVLFFVSVGMLFDPGVIVREPLLVAAVLLVIVLGKSLAAFGIVWVLGFPASTGLLVSASLAQIGEFSFILAGLGIALGLMPPEGMNLVLAGALISITINPLVFAGADRLCAHIRAHPNLLERCEMARDQRLRQLENVLESAEARAKEKASARKTFSQAELAKCFPMFAQLTPEQMELLLLHFETEEASPGMRVIRAGDKAEKIYFISEGEAEVAVGGKRIKLQPGDYFGEMALISGAPRSADVTATDYCRFATLGRRDFKRFLQRFPGLRSEIASQAARREEMNREAVPEDAV